MASSDEDTLKATRPQVAVWVDKLRHAGHVVFVRKMRSGAKRNAGFRIEVDGRAMTTWQIFARFRSVVGGGPPQSVKQTKALTVNLPKQFGD